MTTKPVKAETAAHRLPPLPSPPKMDMEQTRHFVLPGIPGTLAAHLNAIIPGSTTLVGGNGYLCRRRSDLPRWPYPDLLISFNVDWEDVLFTNGYVYVIEEAGKPPDLVLEIGSSSTGRRNYIARREIYAGFGVTEYWRFDHTGGRYHDVPLACDLLTPDGIYQPMALTTEPDGVVWAYSEVLGLSVCWVEGRLRFWDRVQQRYLPGQREQAAELAEAQARAETAEARIRLLEEELRSMETP